MNNDERQQRERPAEAGHDWLDTLWRAVERESLTDPIYNRVVVGVSVGVMTREVAVSALIAALTLDNRRMLAAELERLRNEKVGPICRVCLGRIEVSGDGR